MSLPSISAIRAKDWISAEGHKKEAPKGLLKHAHLLFCFRLLAVAKQLQHHDEEVDEVQIET